MIKLKSSDTAPPDVCITVIRGDEMFCYFADDHEVIEADAQRVREQEQHARAQLKHARDQAIKRITVTAFTGHTFNADETSQQRIARVIMVMDETETIRWTLADNTIAAVTKSELIEALKLATIKQTELWNIDKK
jgi:hypothetical protein